MNPIPRTDQQTEATIKASPRHVLLVASLAVAIITVLAYLPTLSSDFVRLDDYQYVVDNERIRDPSFEGAWRFVTEVTHPSTVEGYYQPLTMLSLMLDALIAGAPAAEIGPFVFHLTNVLLHAVTAVMVFLILHLVFGGVRVPLICALIFALHPVQVESVAWISQRKTVLATVLAAGAVLCYLIRGSLMVKGDAEEGARRESHTSDSTSEEGARRDSRTSDSASEEGARRDSRTGGAVGWGRRQWLAMTFVLYLLANLAKPTVMLLPLLLPLLDYWPLRRNLRAALMEKWPFFVAMIGFGYIAVVSQTSAGEGAGMAVARFSSFELVTRWIGLVSYNLMLYVGNLIWPAYLSPFREMPADQTLANPMIFLSIAGAVGLFLLWVVSFRRWPALFVGLGAAAIMLSPALGPVRFMASLVADRFLYLPLIFLLLPVAAFFSRLERVFPSRVTIVRAAAAIWLVPLILLARGQQSVWQDSHSLWSRVAQIAPNFDQAPSNLAYLALQEGRFDEAVANAERADALNPGNGIHMHLLARAYTRTGQTERALPIIRDALELGLGPAEGSGYVALAEALACLGQDDEAAQACEDAIARGYPPAACFEEVADTVFRFARDYDRAVVYYRKSLEYEPENLVVRWNLGTALGYAGKSADSLAQYEQVRREYERLGVEFPLELEAAMLRLRRTEAGGDGAQIADDADE